MQTVNLADLDLNAYTDAELKRLLELVKMQKAWNAELSLFDFYRDYCWPAVEGEKSFMDNWHLRTIAEHLEAVTAGDIKRLVINVPFRTSKSTLVSVAWPAWTWLKDPGHQWLCGSFAARLAIRDALKMRRVITSPAFISDFGDRFALVDDQNTKQKYENDKGGYRIAFGFTGGVMGDGADTVLIDDPHDRQGANSEAERESALTTFDEAITTRLNEPARSPIVLIMQRLHQNDLSGHVLKQKGVWEHLMLPMRYEPMRACSTKIGFKDPRTKDGELLWPERFPEKTVSDLERTLGSYGASGQLAQRPAPSGGGIYKVNKFRMWPASKPIPDLKFVLYSLDTAFTAKTAGDPTGCQVWGTFDYENKSHVLLLDCWNEHLEYPALRKRAMEDWNARYGGVKNDVMKPSRKVDMFLIENKGSGISLIQELALAGVHTRPYNPGLSDKISRAHMVSPIIEADVVWVLESKRDRGRPISWARPMLDQLEAFPNAEHDEMSDCISQALAWLRDAHMLDLDFVSPDEIEERDYARERKQAVNPYG